MEDTRKLLARSSTLYFPISGADNPVFYRDQVTIVQIPLYILITNPSTGELQTSIFFFSRHSLRLESPIYSWSSAQHFREKLVPAAIKKLADISCKSFAGAGSIAPFKLPRLLEFSFSPNRIAQLQPNHSQLGMNFRPQHKIRLRIFQHVFKIADCSAKFELPLLFTYSNPSCPPGKVEGHSMMMDTSEVSSQNIKPFSYKWIFLIHAIFKSYLTIGWQKSHLIIGRPCRRDFKISGFSIDRSVRTG
jgi:hypothetical protein